MSKREAVDFLVYKATMLGIDEGIVIIEKTGTIVDLNPSAQQIIGFEEEVKGKLFCRIFKVIDEETGREMMENPVAKVLKTGKPVERVGRAVVYTKQGPKAVMINRVVPVKNDREELFGAIAVFRSVVDERIWYRDQGLRPYDLLTGVYNRKMMEEHIKRLENSDAFPLGVIMIDVNGLRFVNNVFGCEEGDKLLKKTAEILKKSARQNDLIARWGGDEFLIILPHADLDEVEGVISRIKIKCSSIDDAKVQLSLVMGYAIRKNQKGSLTEIIKEAEEFMYRRKLMVTESYHNTVINTLLTTLHVKSIETQEHAERLKKYSLMIGKEINLSYKDLDELALLAVLHDIGKIGIKESILKKPGPLTPQEWEEMKQHCEIGFRIVQNIPELSAVAEYILFHHERWDGKGYPRGLKGKEIPLLCRVLSVVDAYDAMTHDRIYRKAMSDSEAIAEIKKNSGTQFDPDIVDVFCDLVMNNK
ncbi:MAG: diguanylate cyclase [Clostridiales bacterium]|nr:diguanylate cyclase [Clostridiales bacterium]